MHTFIFDFCLCSVCPLSMVLEVLESNGKLDKDIVERTKEFIRENRFDGNVSEPKVEDQVKKAKTTVGSSLTVIYFILVKRHVHQNLDRYH